MHILPTALAVPGERWWKLYWNVLTPKLSNCGESLKIYCTVESAKITTITVYSESLCTFPECHESLQSFIPYQECNSQYHEFKKNPPHTRSDAQYTMNT